MLAKFNIPFWLEEGKIGKINIKIPINPTTQHIVVNVENVLLRIVSIRENRVYKLEPTDAQKKKLDEVIFVFLKKRKIQISGQVVWTIGKTKSRNILRISSRLRK